MEYLDSLTNSQKETLESFQNLCGEDDIAKSIKILQKFDWKLESAYQYFTGGEINENNLDSASSSTNNINNNTNNNSNGNTNNNNNQVARMNPIFGLLLSPFRIALSIIHYITGMFPSVFRNFLEKGKRNNRIYNSKTTTEKFITHFEENYGKKHPNFYKGSYKQALIDIKRNLQFLLVVISSPEHDDTPEFCKNVLASDEFINYINEKNMLIWVGSVTDNEGYKVNNVFSVTTYPFIGLVVVQGNRPIIAEKIEGLQPVSDIIEKIQDKYEQYSVQIQAALAERREREQSRIIRQEQESAYEESLRKDRERERKEQLERERIKREEEEERQRKLEHDKKVEEKREYKRKLAENLAPEPDSSEGDITRLSIRLPDGSRLIRKFRVTDKLKDVYDFVESKDLQPYDILTEVVLVNTFPRQKYFDREQTLKELGLFPNSSLIVEEVLEE